MKIAMMTDDAEKVFKETPVDSIEALGKAMAKIKIPACGTLIRKDGSIVKIEVYGKRD